MSTELKPGKIQEHYFVQISIDGTLNFANQAFDSIFISNEAKQIFSFEDTMEAVSLQKWRKALHDFSAELNSEISISLIHQNNKNEKVSVTWHFIRQLNGRKTLFEGFGKIEPDYILNKEISDSGNNTLLEARNLEKLIDSSLDVICCFDIKGKFLKVSAACYYIWGYQPNELLGKPYLGMIHPDDINKAREITQQILKGKETHNYELRNFTHDGSIVSIAWSSRWDNVEEKFYSVARDATEKKETEAALKASEEKYKLLFYNHPIPMWIYDAHSFEFIEVNEAAIVHYGYTRQEFLQMTIKDIRSAEEQESFDQFHYKNSPLTPFHKGYWLHKKKNGNNINVEITANLFMHEGKEAKLVIAIDRTEQLNAERELIVSNERFELVSKATFEAIWDCDLINNKIVWNEGFTYMFGYQNLEIYNRANWWENHLHPEDRERVINKLKFQLQTGQKYWEDEYRYQCANGTYKYIYDRGYIIFDSKLKPIRIIGAMQDLTERKAHELLLNELNISLEKRASELTASNLELERFAYIASHDLQEPLRMITSFLELLQKKYQDEMDEKTQDYIYYAVDGAERMKALILDLLEYSKVNNTRTAKESIDTNNVLSTIKNIYAQQLKESSGSLISNGLPVVMGNHLQILQLFQNLVGNALKYKSDIPPKIEITCKENETDFEFCIADNGIGIDPKYFPKIFIIFQRLHNRSKYSGTGIGLAICKKIVEGHGGNLWVSSEPGVGSSFYFTLPKVHEQ